jgi:alpha-2-macroglobulin
VKVNPLKQSWILLLVTVMAVLVVQYGHAQERLAVFDGVFTVNEDATLIVYAPPGKLSLRVERLLEPERMVFEQSDRPGPTVMLKQFEYVSPGSDRESDTQYVPFGRLPEGVYRVRVQRQTQEETGLIYVTRLALTSKRGLAKTMVWTTDVITGKPLVADVFRLEGKTPVSVRSDQDGLASLPKGAQTEGGFRLVACAGKSWAFSDEQSKRFSTEPVPTRRTFMFTDRPTYRPGERVHVRGVVFDPRDGKPIPNVPIAPEIQRVGGGYGSPTLYEPDGATSGPFGSFGFEWLIPADAVLGEYDIGLARIRVEANSGAAHTVTLEGAQSRVLKGGQVSYRVRAVPNVGGVLAGAKVRYSAARVEALHLLYGSFDLPDYRNERYSYSDWYEQHFSQIYGSGPRQIRPDELVISGQARLNERGEYNLNLPIKRESNGKPFEYVIRAEVLDENERLSSATQVLEVLPANLKIRVQVLRPPSRIGDVVPVRVTTTDLNDKPLATTVRLSHEHSFREAGSYRVKTERVVNLKTNALGIAETNFRALHNDQDSIVARGVDAVGRVLDGPRDYFSLRDDEIRDSLDRWNERGLRLRLDRATYPIGSTVTASLENPFPGTPVLFTLETNDLRAARVVRSKDRLVRFEVPVTSDDVPSAFVTATLFHDGLAFVGRRRVRVDDPKTRLDVRITAPQPERAGGTVPVRVRTVDVNGRGVPAEFSLAVVDEALFTMRPDDVPDIHEFFYRPRRTGLDTNHSRGFSFYPSTFGSRIQDPMIDGTNIQPAQTLGATRGATAQRSAQGRRAARATSPAPDYPMPRAEPTVRQTNGYYGTALWGAPLTTDQNGDLTVPVTMPDTPGRWRVTVRAHTSAGLVGQAHASFTNTNDLVTSLSGLPAVIEGDEFATQVTVQNTSDRALTARLEWNATGLKTMAAATPLVTVPAFGRQTLEVQFRAEQVGTATLSALVNGLAIAPRTVTVLPRQFEERLGWTTNGPSRFELPADADLSRAKLRVFALPSLIRAMLPTEEIRRNGMAFFMQQQQPSVRTLLLATYLKRFGQYTGNDLKRLEWLIKESIEQSIEQTVESQRADGGWGEDHNQPSVSNIESTVSVLMDLVRIRRLGVALPANLIERGQTRLQQSLNDPDLFSNVHLNTISQVIYALSQSGQAPLETMRVVLQHPDFAQNSQAILHLSLAYADAGLPEQGRALLSKLSAFKRESPRVALWLYSANGERYEARNGDKITLLVFQAISRLEPKNPLLPKILMALYGSPNKPPVRVPESEYAAVDVLDALVQTQQPWPVSDAVTFSLNGKNVTASEAKDTTLRDLPSAALRFGSNTLTLEGAPGLVYSVLLEYPRDAQNIQARQNDALRITRTYSDPKTRQPVQRVRNGQDVLVTLTVSSPYPQSSVKISDTIPAGFELLEPQDPSAIIDFRNKPSYSEQRSVSLQANRLNITLEPLQRSTKLEYVLRARTPGSFTALPAEATADWDTAINAHTGTDRLVIE